MKPIETLSLGWRTELIFHRFDAEVVPRGEYLLVRTPHNPTQGLCSALIHAVCEHGFDAMGLASLVIVADPADVAIGLYASLGFVRDHAMWYVERQSRDDAPRG